MTAALQLSAQWPQGTQFDPVPSTPQTNAPMGAAWDKELQPSWWPRAGKVLPLSQHHQPRQAQPQLCNHPACTGMAYPEFPLLLLGPQQPVVIGKVNQGVVIDLIR